MSFYYLHYHEQMYKHQKQDESEFLKMNFLDISRYLTSCITVNVLDETIIYHNHSKIMLLFKNFIPVNAGHLSISRKIKQNIDGKCFLPNVEDY